jgi:methionyl aminopeptidase
MKYNQTKTASEIQKIKESGAVLKQILYNTSAFVKPGITTKDIDDFCAEELKAFGAISACKDYPSHSGHGAFPGYLCISVNEEAVHGIPGNKIINNGDIISLDLAISYNNYYADSAITIPVGDISDKAKNLIYITKSSLELITSILKPNVQWSSIAKIVQHYIESNGYGVIKAFAGHGIGTKMHEEPKVINYYDLKDDFTVLEGMVLAIEPMVTEYSSILKIENDGWTAKTVDNGLVAHFEHTVVINKNGVEILT